MFSRLSNGRANPLWVRILSWSLVIAIIAAGIGMILAPEGTFEMVDETGIENLYIKGTWVQLGTSKQLSITQGTITLQDGTYAITSGEGWAEEDGTFKLTITIEMGPFYEPCDSPPPTCEPCPPEPCPSPPTGKCATIKAYHSSYQLGAWDVSQGETFTIYSGQGEGVLPSSIDFYVCGRKVTVDVSCALESGMTFNGFKVVSVDKLISKDCDGGCKDGYDCGQCGGGCTYGGNGYGYGGYGCSGCGGKSGCSGYGYGGYGGKDGCSCNYGYDCGNCEEKCKGIKSLTLKYVGECCEDDGSDGCNVSDCCDSSNSESSAVCEQYKTVTIELQGTYCNIVTFEEIVGEVKQPVSGCCYVPTYVYKYTYRSDFSLCGLLDGDQYVGFSGTFTWW